MQLRGNELVESELVSNRVCSVEMIGRAPCGRPIHTTLATVDKDPVCLMHSRRGVTEDDDGDGSES